MIEKNPFVQGTLGYAACSNLTEADKAQSDLGCKTVLTKSEEVKKILEQESAVGADLQIGASTRTVDNSAMTIAKAVEAYASPENNSLSGKTIVDAVVTEGTEGVKAVYSVAPMKATSVCVGLLREGVIDSTHIVSQATKQITNNVASVRDRTVRTDLPEFSSEEDLDELREAGIIAKSVDISDFDVAAVLDWKHLYDYDTLNLLIMIARRVSEGATQNAIREFTANNKPDLQTLLMLLRLQNRPVADSIFKEVYESYYGEVRMSTKPEASEIENIQRYHDLLKRYHASLIAIGGGRNISPNTIQIGIKRLRVVTSPKQNVSSIKKINKVKTNAVNSYFRMNPEDTGLFTAVCTEAAQKQILKRFAPNFVAVGMRWLLNEQYNFLGLDDYIEDIPDEMIAELAAPKVEQATTASLLGLESIEAEAKAQLIKEFYSLAKNVITNERDDRAIAAINAVDDIMGND